MTVAAGCALAALALVGCASPSGKPDGKPSAAETAGPSVDSDAPVPVIAADFPDPDVLLVGGTYYAYATQPLDGSVNVALATSTDLRTWTVEVMDPLPELPSWATNGRT